MEDELEKKRKKNKSFIIKYFTLTIAICIGLVYLLENVVLSVICVQVSLLVGLILVITRTIKYRSEFKQYYVEKWIGAEFDNCTYDSKQGITEAEIRNTGIIKMGNRYSADDKITGIYNGVKFEQSDIEISQETRDSKGNSQRVHYFYGKWLIFDFNKDFKYNLKICEKGISEISKSHGYEVIKLEDEAFNKKFNTYAHNGHEAFYILTPHFMEKLKKVENLHTGRIFFAFINSKLHVGIHNYTHTFKFKSYKKEREEDIKKQIASEMEIIKVIIEELGLDEHLFKNQ